MTRVAIVQTNPEFGNAVKNIADAAELVGSVEADLYVLPELFTTGYNFINRKEAEKLSEPADGTAFRAMAALAAKLKAHIAYGFAEKKEHCYNSAALVGPKGMAGLYRKVHLYARETLFFAPGDLGFPVFELPFGRVGIMVCFDWIYPESARTLALRGAQIIAHPSNLVMPYCPDAMITRCLENKIYAATANRIGTEQRGGLELHYIGTSGIVSPSGEILMRMGADETGIRVVEVDLRAALNKKINRYNDLITGRRPSEYKA
ncbi:MAG TPA: nitrilase-related carbon-nitrogen hydrolase [Bacteroidota bacterium]|nr:nitrilase-related carbon-nitrogen hydrolase [Bacteroidota bacterium]